jgi:hypothetical protein
MSTIVALTYISLSELQTMDSKYTEEWVLSNKEELTKTLYELGLNTKLPWSTEINTHRNRFGNIITCSRFVGNERMDKEWLSSEYVSREAIDKARNNRLVNDLYRSRGLVE